MKLTFKKEKREKGLAGIGMGDTTQIKADGQVCGVIQEASWNSDYKGWRVQLMVMKPQPDENPNCDWKWIFIKHPFGSENEAREYLKTKWEWIQTVWKLRMEEKK